MQDIYGCDDIAKALADVNLDVIFILFPVEVVPTDPDVDEKSMHMLRALKDYPVNQEHLPKGLIMFDMVKIEYPE